MEIENRIESEIWSTIVALNLCTYQKKLDEYLSEHNGEKQFSYLLCNKKYSGSFILRKKMQQAIRHNLDSDLSLTSQLISSISFLLN